MKNILTLAFLVLMLMPLQAQTERRLALLIGNNNYHSIPSLRSPYKDVDDMAKALRECGFEVMPIVKDGSKERIDKAVIEFSNRLTDYDVGMFYYSGHGAEVDGKNYIIPIDLPSGYSKQDIEYRCVNTDWLQSRMAGAGAYNKTFIVVLDACRNNPFKSLSSKKDVLDPTNWAPPKNIPSGTIVCYAASSGQTASDGGSTVNSPYTARFLKHMKVPNLSIENVFKRVRIEMSAEEQEPQENTKLRTDFYFVRKSESDIYTSRTTPTDDRMVFIPGGTFEMGSNEGQEDEKPVHSVTLSSFYLSKFEVTVADFMQFVNEAGYVTDAEKEGFSWEYDGEWKKLPNTNWRHDCKGNARPSSEYNHPVIHVSWNDATAYCKWMSNKHNKTYRLPTEAEWEYAAGNGRKHTKYSWGNGQPVGKIGGNVADESKSPINGRGWSVKFEGYNDGYWFTAPVGSYYPNELGLHDMTGNVWEWCSDYCKYENTKVTTDTYYEGAVNPECKTGSHRVIRGGSWISNPRYCRVSFRNNNDPDYRDLSIGFRLASSVQK